MSKRKYYFTIAGLSAILVVGAYISIHMGSIKIPMSAAFQSYFPNFVTEKLSDSDLESFMTIIKDVRAPRILAAILCGLALSVSGAAYQSMFRNPLVSPEKAVLHWFAGTIPRIPVQSLVRGYSCSLFPQLVFVALPL